jgi:hypothetical protein
MKVSGDAFSFFIFRKLIWNPLRSRLYAHEVKHAAGEVQVKKKQENQFEDKNLLLEIFR